MSDICIDIVSNHVIRAYDISANGIDVVSVHKLFAYRFMSTARIDVVSGHIKYCRLHMVSQDSRCMGDGRMHYAPFCYHGYVPLRCGGGGDVVMGNGTNQQQSGWGKYGLLCRMCATVDTFR